RSERYAPRPPRSLGLSLRGGIEARCIRDRRYVPFAPAALPLTRRARARYCQAARSGPVATPLRRTAPSGPTGRGTLPPARSGPAARRARRDPSRRAVWRRHAAVAEFAAGRMAVFELKQLSPESIPSALEKAIRYRLLNQPWEAENIYL